MIKIGDRYELNVKCSYCNEKNLCWYAPTCCSDVFKCNKCGKNNFITTEFKAMKIENLSLEDIEDGFINTSNYGWSEEEITRMCEDRFNQIKEMI